MKAILTIGMTSWLCPNAAAAAKVADALSQFTPIDYHCFPETDVEPVWGPHLKGRASEFNYETKIEQEPDDRIVSLTALKKLYADATVQAAAKLEAKAATDATRTQHG